MIIDSSAAEFLVNKYFKSIAERKKQLKKSSSIKTRTKKPTANKWTYNLGGHEYSPPSVIRGYLCQSILGTYKSQTVIIMN